MICLGSDWFPTVWSVSCYEYLKPYLIACQIVFGSSAFSLSSVSLILALLSCMDCLNRANCSGEYLELGS